MTSAFKRVRGNPFKLPRKFVDVKVRKSLRRREDRRIAGVKRRERRKSLCASVMSINIIGQEEQQRIGQGDQDRERERERERERVRERGRERERERERERGEAI
jgi:hypothetical protein